MEDNMYLQCWHVVGRSLITVKKFIKVHMIESNPKVCNSLIRSVSINQQPFDLLENNWNLLSIRLVHLTLSHTTKAAKENKQIRYGGESYL